MAAAIKKPSREKEEARAGNMMLDVHLLHPFQPSSSRKPNRENRIKNACFSNSHSNIAPSNDKRPLFVQILAIPSASLVSTSLPVQYLRPTNFFFFRRIFLNSFLRDQISMTREQQQAGVSSNFDHSRGEKAGASSKFDHASRDFACIGDKKTRARAEAAQRTSRTI